MVERPPKHNGTFHRPLKLMAVYNLRNQQAVTCNTGATSVCVLCVLNPYLYRENPFISRYPAIFSSRCSFLHLCTSIIFERPLGFPFFLPLSSFYRHFSSSASNRSSEHPSPPPVPFHPSSFVEISSFTFTYPSSGSILWI